MNGEKGTLVWAYKKLSGDGITQLLNDLIEREDRGVSQAVCKEIQTRLARITNVATENAYSGLFSRPLYYDFEKLEHAYRRWNGPEEDRSVEACIHRIQCISDMRKHCQKIAKKTRKILNRMRRDQHILSQEHDLRAVDSMFKAFEDICTEAPGIFRNLSKAIRRYCKGRKLDALNHLSD